MVITLQTVQRVEIECTNEEYPQAVRHLMRDNFRLILNGPKVEDGSVNVDIRHLVGEKVITKVGL